MSRTATLRVVAPIETVAEVVDLLDYRTERHVELVQQARDLMIANDEEAAFQRCLQALRLERSYEALALAGTLVALLGQPEASIGYTTEAIRVDGERPDAYYDLASTLLELNRPEEALDWLERGARLLGKRQDDLVDFIYSARIEALGELARFDEAEAVLAQARERSEDALNLLNGAAAQLESARRRVRLRVV